MFLVIIFVVTAKGVTSYSHDTCMEERHLYIICGQEGNNKTCFVYMQQYP